MFKNRVFLQKYRICRSKQVRVRRSPSNLLRRSRLPCMLSFLSTFIIISNNISISFHGFRKKLISLYKTICENERYPWTLQSSTKFMYQLRKINQLFHHLYHIRKKREKNEQTDPRITPSFFGPKQPAVGCFRPNFLKKPVD